MDDNLDSAESLSMLLQLTGNETQLAFDGIGAVDAAASFRPDVVLMDIGSAVRTNPEVTSRQTSEYEVFW